MKVLRRFGRTLRSIVVGMLASLEWRRMRKKGVKEQSGESRVVPGPIGKTKAWLKLLAERALQALASISVSGITRRSENRDASLPWCSGDPAKGQAECGPWLTGSREGRLGRRGLARVQLDAGGETHLVILREAAQEVPQGMLASGVVLPARPPEIERTGRKAIPGLHPVGRFDGPEQIRGQPGDDVRRVEILGDRHLGNVESAEPAAQAVLGHVAIMVGRLVERLEEGRVHHEPAPRLENAENLGGRPIRVVKMLKRVETHDRVERRFGEWKMMRVGGDVGVAEEGVFQLDDVLELDPRLAGADVENPAVEPGHPVVDLARGLVAEMLDGHDPRRGVAGQEDGSAGMEREAGLTAVAPEGVALQPQRGAAGRAGQEWQQEFQTRQAGASDRLFLPPE